MRTRILAATACGALALTGCAESKPTNPQELAERFHGITGETVEPREAEMLAWQICGGLKITRETGGSEDEFKESLAADSGISADAVDELVQVATEYNCPDGQPKPPDGATMGDFLGNTPQQEPSPSQLPPPRDESPINGHERVYSTDGMSNEEIARGCTEGWIHPQACFAAGH
jgi:hypothetical protein